MEVISPTLTIITVVYNAAKALEDTIRNVACLNYPDVKYIIVDGGSTDETLDVIKKNSSSVYKWISEPDKGIYDAMNKGWTLAPEKSYVLFLGAGDTILTLPETISPLYNEVIFGEVYKGSELFRSVYNFKLKLSNTLHHQALLVPKSLHPQPPFNLEFKLYADFDFNQRLNKTKVPFHYSAKFRAYALPGGISAARSDSEMLSIVRKNYGDLMYLLASIYYKIQKLKVAVTKFKRSGTVTSLNALLCLSIFKLL